MGHQRKERHIVDIFKGYRQKKMTESFDIYNKKKLIIRYLPYRIL